MKKTVVYFWLVSVIFLISCTDRKAPESIQQTPAQSGTPIAQPLAKTAQPVVQNTNLSKNDSKDAKDKEKEQKDASPEPKEHDAPCCHESSEVVFQELDVHGKLVGLNAELLPNKEYQAKLMIVGDTENLENYSLRARASMAGMDHKIDFPTERISAREYKINPVVFSMAGKWDISIALLNQNEESVDACTCKAVVK